MIPAYIPNPAAAAIGGGTPLDGGRFLSDGRRILGDGKTIRGFVGGALSGIGAGCILIYARPLTGLEWLPIHTPVSITLLSVGALTGDLVKSFLKRRLGKKRGESWPVADQYDLVVGAMAFLLIGDYAWLTANVTPLILLIILFITPLLHRGANIIGYMIGVKDVPW
ncbi:MAG: CDP-2,3-bis-(O-geranylgeranyl)-sn-glycerol synthase [Methanoculleaceae archaeon]